MRRVCRSLSRLSVFAVLSAVALGLLAVPPASASVAGRRNTAAVLTGIAAYHLSKGHYPEGLALAGASVYAWGKVNEKKRAERYDRRYRPVRRHAHAYRPATVVVYEPVAYRSARHHRRHDECVEVRYVKVKHHKEHGRHHGHD